MQRVDAQADDLERARRATGGFNACVELGDAGGELAVAALEAGAALARHGELEPPVRELLGRLALGAHRLLVLRGALGEAARELVGQLARGAGGGPETRLPV